MMNKRGQQHHYLSVMCKILPENDFFKQKSIFEEVVGGVVQFYFYIDDKFMDLILETIEN